MEILLTVFEEIVLITTSTQSQSQPTNESPPPLFLATQRKLRRHRASRRHYLFSNHFLGAGDEQDVEQHRH